MGTGCDTILAQIAAEVLDCSVDNIAVFGADTDASPYDSGSYASSTTYVTGKATELCAIELREKIINFGAGMLGISPEDAQFDGEKVIDIKSGKSCSLRDIATSSMNGHSTIEATHSHSSKSSPPPFMVGACELEVDLETGEVKVVEFDAAVDCGTPVNPNLARVQAEGGILQGIGMALSENIQYTNKGVVMNNSLMQYKIPTRMDIGEIKVAFESSYENQGPFGAKSIGEVVINTPLASIADALSVATGVRFTELPIMPEQIALKKQFFDKK
jgi:CO/xanthine dehydrogenase Mo-binding subunit